MAALDADVDGPYRYPADPLPMHVSIWERKEGSDYRANGVIRVMPDDMSSTEPYIVERFGRGWARVGTIRRTYRFENGTRFPATSEV